jgi:hypothetical protein
MLEQEDLLDCLLSSVIFLHKRQAQFGQSLQGEASFEAWYHLPVMTPLVDLMRAKLALQSYIIKFV